MNTLELGVDIYISFSKQDEDWVRENLVGVLSATPHYFTVCMNKYDTVSHIDPLRHIRAREHNARRIESCKVFIAVCSRHYNDDPTGRLQFEREVARNCKVYMIAVNKDASETKVSDLFDVDSVSFSRQENEHSIGNSQDVLLRKISITLNSL